MSQLLAAAPATGRAELDQTVTRLLGGDFGNSTALLSDGQRVLQIPSYIAQGNLSDLLTTRAGSGSAARLATNEYAIEYRGRTYFVGELALSQARGATSERADTSRYINGHTLKLLLALAGALYDETEIRVRLVTGVPPAVLKEQPDIKREIALTLLGKHEYTFYDQRGSRRITLNVEAVAVVMEGVAALAVLGEPGKPMGLVDVGGHTVDVAWFDAQGRVVESRTGTLPDAGIEWAGEALSQQFRRAHGRLLLPAEIDSVFRAYLAGQPGVIYHRGEKTITVEEVAQVLDDIAQRINTFLAQLWRLGSDGFIAADAAYVVFIGGGALYVTERITVDTQRRLPEHPQQANVHAYARFANRIEERGSWPRWE